MYLEYLNYTKPPEVYFGESLERGLQIIAPWENTPPSFKGSSTKKGRNKKQIKKNRKKGHK